MKSKSSTAKGKRFENAVAKIVEDMGLGFARREAGSGNGMRKGDIAWSLKKTAELKNHTRNFPKILIQWIEQAERQALGYQPWVLVLRDPRSSESKLKAFAMMDMHEWLDLEKRSMTDQVNEPDAQMRMDLGLLKRYTLRCRGFAMGRDEWDLKQLSDVTERILKRLNH